MGTGSALIVVDMQNDFCPGGSLAVAGGDDIIPVINRYLELFQRRGACIIASRDWHPRETSHFRKFGGIWPEHCIQGSDGARFRAGLDFPPGTLIFSKGMDPARDDYSALQALADSGEPLCRYLEKEGVEEIYLCGLATDYCVLRTALESATSGFRAKVLADAVRGVDVNEGDSDRAMEEMMRAGVEILTIDDLLEGE